MYEGFDPKVKSEVIVISGLNNYNLKGSYCCYNYWNMLYNKKVENPKKSDKEIEAEIKGEIKISIDKLKEESIRRYYKIDNEKTKELVSIFKQIKLKVKFDSKIGILRDGKYYIIHKGYLFIYDNKLFNKLHIIKLENNYNYTSVIQLDNQDLILFSEYELNVYRLINNKFFIVQKIYDNRAGYETQYSGCVATPIIYRGQFIKEISDNRFILVCNYGYKIYSLNEKNEYSITLQEEYHMGLKKIIELDKNTFIFLSELECDDPLEVTAYNILNIDKIKLKEISNYEKNKKLNNIKKRDYYKEEELYLRYFNFRNKKPAKKVSEEEIKNVIESLKYTHINQELLNYSIDESHHYFKGNAILKNKYLIVAIDNNILIFDISSCKQLKRYEILLYGEDNLYKCNINLKKWNNSKDNQFLINLAGNIVLFELINEYELKIINQIYFKDIKNLKQFDEKYNKFYDDGKIEDLYSGGFCSGDKNKTFSVSIFY